MNARQRMEQVLRDCQAALQSDPKLAPAYFLRGTVHARQGRHAEAIADFTEVIRLDPTFVMAYIERARVAATHGHSAAAAIDLTEAIRLDPQNALAHASLGLVYQLSGDLEHALAHWHYACGLAPRLILACWFRGLTRTRNTKYKEVIAACTKGIPPAPVELPRAAAHETKEAPALTLAAVPNAPAPQAHAQAPVVPTPAPVEAARAAAPRAQAPVVPTPAPVEAARAAAPHAQAPVVPTPAPIEAARAAAPQVRDPFNQGPVETRKQRKKRRPGSSEPGGSGPSRNEIVHALNDMHRDLHALKPTPAKAPDANWTRRKYPAKARDANSTRRKYLIGGSAVLVLGLICFIWLVWRESNGLYPVSGTVTIEGAPAVGAIVELHRLEGDDMKEPTIMGFVEKDGTFTLCCGNLGEGAPPGSYVVLIRSPKSSGGNPILDRYADRKHPQLSAVIKAEPNKLAYNLK